MRVRLLQNLMHAGKVFQAGTELDIEPGSRLDRLVAQGVVADPSAPEPAHPDGGPDLGVDVDPPDDEEPDEGDDFGDEDDLVGDDEDGFDVEGADRDELRAKAAELDLEVDGRWGTERLRDVVREALEDS